MHAILIAAALLASVGLFAAPAAAQGHAGHDMGAMTPAALAAHCAQMKQDAAGGSHADTPEMRKMMTQCDELDRNAVAASRRR